MGLLFCGSLVCVCLLIVLFGGGWLCLSLWTWLFVLSSLCAVFLLRVRASRVLVLGAIWWLVLPPSRRSASVASWGPVGCSLSRASALVRWLVLVLWGLEIRVWLRAVWCLFAAVGLGVGVSMGLCSGLVEVVSVALWLNGFGLVALPRLRSVSAYTPLSWFCFRVLVFRLGRLFGLPCFCVWVLGWSGLLCVLGRLDLLALLFALSGFLSPLALVQVRWPLRSGFSMFGPRVGVRGTFVGVWVLGFGLLELTVFAVVVVVVVLVLGVVVVWFCFVCGVVISVGLSRVLLVWVVFLGWVVFLRGQLDLGVVVLFPALLGFGRWVWVLGAAVVSLFCSVVFSVGVWAWGVVIGVCLLPLPVLAWAFVSAASLVSGVGVWFLILLDVLGLLRWGRQGSVAGPRVRGGLSWRLSCCRSCCFGRSWWACRFRSR
ncbi:hypothetical protein [Aureimonas jatrophae]|uniref:TRAP-type C4-dicarboxylate transport system, small permease component n=1 Tax=Aureimonas jatrophae TaxID=1166073 RepID=A0A1H0EJQ2_9HYPH|nr:hypothetical protein [Aureimonas jatrophae]SDN82582.1 TRAP-type C4-dicarboxylate transport system, small permease component [Aureimonas jatrophae]